VCAAQIINIYNHFQGIKQFEISPPRDENFRNILLYIYYYIYSETVNFRSHFSIYDSTKWCDSRKKRNSPTQSSYNIGNPRSGGGEHGLVSLTPGGVDSSGASITTNSESVLLLLHNNSVDFATSLLVSFTSSAESMFSSGWLNLSKRQRRSTAAEPSVANSVGFSATSLCGVAWRPKKHKIPAN